MKRRVYSPSNASNRNGRRLWSDNITLIPASQLPFKDEWERIASGLPAREALFVVPEAETPFKRVARALVSELQTKGRHVTVTASKPC